MTSQGADFPAVAAKRLGCIVGTRKVRPQPLRSLGLWYTPVHRSDAKLHSDGDASRRAVKTSAKIVHDGRFPSPTIARRCTLHGDERQPATAVEQEYVSLPPLGGITPLCDASRNDGATTDNRDAHCAARYCSESASLRVTPSLSPALRGSIP